MKYNYQRTLNLGRFGCPYESVVVGVTEAETSKQAREEVLKQIKDIYSLAEPAVKKRLEKLNKQIKLTLAEERERQELEEINILPF